MIEFLENNWYILVAIVAVLVCVVELVIKFFKEPRSEQISNLKEWLKYAVTEAEKALGSGTGQLKLRYVYNLAINKFSFLKFISFEKFSNWVDEALEWLNAQLSQNQKIQDLINSNQEEITITETTKE